MTSVDENKAIASAQSEEAIMNLVLSIFRSAGALCLGSLMALAGFGLVFGLAELPTLIPLTTYKLVAVLLAAASAFLLGGYVSGRLVGRKRILHGGILGLALGLCSIIYVMGPHWLLLVAVPLAGALGALGGRLSSKGLRRRDPSPF